MAAPGRDPERALDHAAEHQLQAQGPGHAGQPDGLLDAAALHQLDVDAVEIRGDPGQVRGLDEALVGEDGDLDPVLEPGVVLESCGRQGLFDELDALTGHPVDHLQGLFLRLPALVGVGPEGLGGDRPDALDDLPVVGGPDLDLVDGEIRGVPDLLLHDRHLVDADGVGRRHDLVPAQAEEPPERDARASCRPSPGWPCPGRPWPRAPPARRRRPRRSGRRIPERSLSRTGRALSMKAAALSAVSL